MKVIKKPVGRRAFFDEIQNDLLSLQEAVDGRIEAVTLGADCVIISNAESVTKCLPYNCNILGMSFYGDIVIVGIHGEKFTDVTLPIETFNKVVEWDFHTAVNHLLNNV